MKKVGSVSVVVMFAILMAAFVTIEACAPSTYVTSERREVYRRPTTNKAGGTRIEPVPVRCRTGETKCTDDHYYVCIGTKAYCGPCHNVTETYDCPSSKRGTCERIRRVCNVSNVRFSIPDSVDLAEDIPDGVAANAIQCNSRWVVNYGFRSGSFWMHIPERDGRCENSIPRE